MPKSVRIAVGMPRWIASAAAVELTVTSRSVRCQRLAHVAERNLQVRRLGAEAAEQLVVGVGSCA